MKLNDFVYIHSFQIPLEERIKLGALIKSLREEKKMTLFELSEKSKIRIDELFKIEDGVKLRINPFYLKVIANIFQVDYKLFYKIIKYLD